ncbi:MAG: hypothetical protein CMC55_06895 [Flavobacteriaceae bacterium]|uniref:dienelactone hydrolase family protein n=1 Tax=Bizionia echini TaxID=649333 RepID=UPI000C92856E|nr:hypothetical protein [Flavobacteriaceae bacterium]
MNKKIHFSIITLLLFILGVHSQINITNHIAFGKHQVGYKVFHTYDNSRSFFQKYDYYGNRTEYPIGRPMQVSIWYPSKLGNKFNNLLYKDYIGFTSSEINFEKTSIEDKDTSINALVNSLNNKAKQDQLKKILNSNTHALLDVDEITGDFPIILYAPPMNTSAIDNSIMCEYLASKGYVVLSVMAKGEFSQLQQRNLNAVEVQAEDLAFLLQYAKRKYPSDKIGVFGFSLGGLSNIVFASKNKAVDATISLDGSIMSQGWLNDFTKSELYNPERFTSNLLFIGKNLKSPDQNPATFLENVKYADKALIRYDIENHNYFSGLFLLYEMVNNDTLSEDEKETHYKFYAEMTNYIGLFFDHYLKDKNSFKEYEPISHDFSFQFKKGKRAPLDPNSIGQLIIEKGADYVETIIDSTLTYEEDYLNTVDWRSLFQTASTLRNNNQVNEAIKTLLLADRVMPDFYTIHRELGNLYLEKNNSNLAAKHYQKALADNPRDVESSNALKQLKIKIPDYHDTRIEDLQPYLGKYIVDSERYREVYLEDGKLYLESNYWVEPIILWPYKANVFLVESDNPRDNMQILFQFNTDEEVVSMSIRGLNSGRVNAPNIKEQ